MAPVFGWPDLRLRGCRYALYGDIPPEKHDVLGKTSKVQIVGLMIGPEVGQRTLADSSAAAYEEYMCQQLVPGSGLPFGGLGRGRSCYRAKKVESTFAENLLPLTD